MRILWLTVDRSHRIAQHFDDFRKTVSSLIDIKVLMKSPAGDRGQNAWQLSQKLTTGRMSVENILSQYLEKDSDFDFIFCDAFFAYMEERWKEVPIPTGIFIEDVHQDVPRRQTRRALESGIETIFYRFNEGFHRYHPRAKMDFKCIWIPHSVRPERYARDIEVSRDVLHVGVYPRSFYPWRAHAIDVLRRKPYFTLVRRPKDRPGVPKAGKWPIGQDYDDLLMSSKVCITGGSIINAPVQKYIEIPLSGAVLMSNWFSDLGMLGFNDEVNMVSYDIENVVEKVEDLLGDSERMGRISEAAKELIMSRHTSEIRGKQFVNCVCEILGRPLEFPGTERCSYQVCFSGISSEVPRHKSGSTSKSDKSGKVVKGIISGTDWRARIAAAASYKN